ncbi:MAG: hypothetical protein ACYSW8_21315, partial [Planctomycetota bacterium]
WHLTAKTHQYTRRRRIAAVMTVNDEGENLTVEIRRGDEQTLEFDAFLGANKASIRVNLDTEHFGREPLLEIRYLPASGETESLSIM